MNVFVIGRVVVGMGLLSFCSTLGFLQADEPQRENNTRGERIAESEYGDFHHHVDVSLTEKVSYGYSVLADVGSIPANKKGMLLIRLHNPNEFSLPVESMHASCSCTKSKLLGTNIPGDGHVDLEVRLKTPKKNDSPDFIGTVDLKIDSKNATVKSVSHVKVRLRYRISEMLCFKDDLIPLSMGSSEPQSFAIPFMSTVKTPVSDLVFSLSSALEGSEGKVASNDSGYSVLLRIDPAVASSSGTYGKLTISDANSGVSDSVNLIIYKEEGVTVSPKTLRFRESGDEDVATGLIRFRDMGESSDPNDLVPESRKSISCEARIGKHKAKVDVRALSDSVFRFKIAFPNDVVSELSDKSSVVTWTLVLGDRRAVIQSKTAY